MNGTDKPNPSLSAFSPQLRMRSSMDQSQVNNNGTPQQPTKSDSEGQLSSRFPSLSSFTGEDSTENFSDRKARQNQKQLEQLYSSSDQVSNNGEGVSISMVNKMLMVGIVGISLSIVGYLFSSADLTNLSANTGQFLNDSVGRVAGVVLEPSESQGSHELSQLDVQNIVREIGERTDLPTDKPEILKVTDPDSFRSRFPVLYRDLQKGDLIIIYKSKTIVYRPGISRFLAIIPR